MVKPYKKKDPHYKREKKKYGIAAPSREYILDYLNQCEKPVTFDHLLVALRVKKDAAIDAFLYRLKAMLRDGEIHQNRRRSYATVKHLELQPGTVQGHRDGYGFVIMDEGGPDVFLPQREMCALFTNDRVLLKLIKMSGRSKRIEGQVIEVLQRRTTELVGQLTQNENMYFVRPDNKAICTDIAITNGEKYRSHIDDYVKIEITQQPSKRRPAMGEIKEVLGGKFDSGMEIELAIANYNLAYEWPPEVLAQAHSIDKNVIASSERRDCRHVDFMTIDGEDARDFDDAIACEKRADGGWVLLVAIADVSHYVTSNSAIDQEAYQRSTSVYFPGRVVPMLPEVLSNDMCSLKPLVDRYAVVAEMTLDPQAKVVSTEFYNAVIQSKARLTYVEANNIIKDTQLLSENSTLSDLYDMYCALRRQREIRGALDFDTAEPRIKLNSKRKIKSIQIKQRLESHRLIEECMLLANVSVAEFIDRSKRPCLYRVHEQPNATKLEQLNNCLRAFSLKLTGDPCPTTLDFSQLLSTISDSPERVFLQKVILRSQQQARYTSDNIGHFGLGYADYTHFTSPIRRYPDLLVHRTLKSLMNQQDPQGCVYTGSEMDAFAEHCSTLERNAEKASRDAVDRLKCDFMKNKIGNTYQGTIVEVTNFGAFVELDKFLVHGLLHITALKNDYYHFDESTLKLEGKHSGIVYKIGDAIEVVLIRVDIEQRKIDFDLPEKTHSVDEKIN